MSHSTALRGTVLFALILACAPAARRDGSPAGRRTAPDGRLITAAQISRSGAANVWEVLQRRAPYLDARHGATGRPAELTQRGRGSLVLDQRVVVAVDGVMVSDLAILETIPARYVESVRILSGATATRYFGTGAAGGAVLVAMKTALDAPAATPAPPSSSP